MQIVIDISEENYKRLMEYDGTIDDFFVEAIKNGTPFRLLEDGTLIVPVNDYYAVKRVLIEDSERKGGLFYADRD